WQGAARPVMTLSRRDSPQSTRRASERREGGVAPGLGLPGATELLRGQGCREDFLAETQGDHSLSAGGPHRANNPRRGRDALVAGGLVAEVDAWPAATLVGRCVRDRGRRVGGTAVGRAGEGVQR